MDLAVFFHSIIGLPWEPDLEENHNKSTPNGDVPLLALSHHQNAIITINCFPPDDDWNNVFSYKTSIVINW